MTVADLVADLRNELKVRLTGECYLSTDALPLIIAALEFAEQWHNGDTWGRKPEHPLLVRGADYHLARKAFLAGQPSGDVR